MRLNSNASPEHVWWWWWVCEQGRHAGRHGLTCSSDRLMPCVCTGTVRTCRAAGAAVGRLDPNAGHELACTHTSSTLSVPHAALLPL